VNGQTLDSAKMRIVYRLAYVPDSTANDKISTDTYFLLIGETVSSFFSYTRFRQDSMFNESHKNGTVQEFLQDPGLRNKFGTGGFYSNCSQFINYPENKITITDAVIIDKFIYEENIEKINWNILSDTSTYLNYLCQKATCTFRGRNYIAWFTPEIPLSNGPYKFQGLPGLILKIADTKNNYVYECKGIERLTEKVPIAITEKKYIKTTRSEFRKLFKESFENPLQSLSSSGVTITVTNADANSSKMNLQHGIPYNPIELE
jgi:GLPGLI family protein